ncbi:MAG: formate dehydrogenase accessory sulfurtransferase FdhD [Gammaproteobacteria bacterium]|nr:formate dehydrogenase accessory sulfurtransferase FdhD [Gammaproteobacteria bacterium]
MSTMPQTMTRPDTIELSHAGLDATQVQTATNEYGEAVSVNVSSEHPLTLYIDKREIVTLMTLGTQPEALTLGYIRNQGFIDHVEQIKSLQVDWETNSVAVITHHGIDNISDKLEKRTVTTGCGQGTMFGNMMDKLHEIKLPALPLKQSQIYQLLSNLNADNAVYKSAGAVHGCALCEGTERQYFIEDVGRHNAVDAIAGLMWLDGVKGDNKIFYTTGRLTSEMVIKVAQMGIPALLSRSGITQMGLELAQQLGITMIARAKGRHFNIFHGSENIVFDAIPAKRSE